MGFVAVDEEKKSSFVPVEEAQPEVSSGNQFPSYGNQFLDAFIQSGAEIGRGLYRGAADVMRPSAGIISQVNPMSGLLGRFAGQGGTPDELNPALAIQNIAQQTAEQIPETSLNLVAKGAYNLIGEAPGLLAQFEQFGPILKGAGISSKIASTLQIPEESAALKGLDEATKFAVTAAASELRKGIPEAIQSAELGASVGLAFPVAARAMEIGKEFGGQAAKALISVVTKNPKLADDYLANPNKYILNPLQSVPNPQEVKEQGVRRIQDLREKLTVQSEDLRVQQQTKFDQLKSTFQTAKEDIKSGLGNSYEAAFAKSQRALSDLENSVNERLLAPYDHAISILGQMKKEKGKAVGDAIESTIANNPFISIPYSEVGTKFENKIKELSTAGKVPFRVGTEGVSAITAAADPSDVSRFNNILQEVLNKKPSGQLTVAYLQTLKGGLQDLADSSFRAGKNQMGNLYGELSKIVNPAKIVSDNPKLAEALPELAKANSEYSSFIPNYENAISHFAKTDASGNIAPDIGKVIRAVQNNDSATLRSIQKSESMIPEQDRILPKVQQVVSETEKAKSSILGQLKSLKREYRIKEKEFISNQNKIMKSVSAENRASALQYNRNKRTTILNAQRTLDDQIKFLEQQSLLRETVPFLAAQGARMLKGFMTPVSSGFGLAQKALESEGSKTLQRFSVNRLSQGE